MNEFAQFTNFNLKLTVIEQLMYMQKQFGEPFDAHEFVKTYTERKIDIEEEGYEIIPELKLYFEQLQIPPQLLKSITSLTQDGGSDIYDHIYPFWDGGCDTFNIQSAEDTELLPNLQSIALFYDEDESILDAFRAKGIEANWI